MLKNKTGLILILIICIVVTSSCGIQKINRKKIKDIDFTVVTEAEVPQEVKQIIEERKEKEFKVTYSDDKYTYIIIGYGKQKYEGYSITVKKLFESSNAIFVRTEFLGPKKYTNNETKTYPVIVIKIKYSDKNVIFTDD